jgi:uncharacterized protein (DUF2236 family)
LKHNRGPRLSQRFAVLTRCAVRHFDPHLAAAVADSAGIYTDPRGRLERTLAYFLTVAVADGRTAIAVSDALMRLHAKAKGIEPSTGTR